MAALLWHGIALAPMAFTVGLLLALDRAAPEVPVVALVLTSLAARQLTVFVVTALYHRGFSHGSVVFHPALERILRVWGWLFTGIGGRTWALVHRWHHATGDGPDAPFSPSRPGGSLLGIGRETVRAHWAAVRDPSALARFRRHLPDDGLERFVHADERRLLGVLGLRLPLLVAAGTLALVAHGLPLGAALAATVACLPAAAGSVAVGAVYGVNGLGHLLGTRRFDTRDTSRNVVGWDLLGLGEALHNNHHARPASARLSVGPGELDLAWHLLVGLRRVGLVRELRE